MEQVLVTLGIPFYNNGRTLLDAIKSIFAQTFQDWELILIDDGSTDNSLEIALSIDDPRVKVISDGQNKKLPARLNQIIDLAHGKYIARMDADDLCSPRRIEIQLQLFEKDPSLDVVGTGMVYLDENDVPLGHRFAPRSHSEICKELCRTSKISHPTIVVRKSWYKKNRYNESVVRAQDYDLWLRSYEHSKFGNVPEALFYYRCEASFNQRKRLTCRLTCTKFLFDHYKKRGHLGKALYYGGMQLVKFFVGAAVCIIRSKRKLIERRYKPLTKNQLEFYEQEIRKIKNTELPVKRLR